MFPFLRNLLGYYRVPRFRLMNSYYPEKGYYLWDRRYRKPYLYFESVDDALIFCKLSGTDIDEVF